MDLWQNHGKNGKSAILQFYRPLHIGGTVQHLNGVEWSAAEACVRMQCSMAPLWKCVKTIGETSVSLRIPWRMRNEPAHASEVNCAGTLMSETCMRETSWSALEHPGDSSPETHAGKYRNWLSEAGLRGCAFR